ncbi:MAG: hypothetical protein ACK52I_33020 [Pseudomonadota bacterium]
MIPGISTDSGEGLQPIPAFRLLGNPSGSLALPIAMTPAEISTLLNLAGTYLALTGGTVTGNLNLGGQLLIERDVPTHVAIAASVQNASLNGSIQYRFQRTNLDFLGSLVAAWRGGTTNNRINIETYGNGDSVDPLFAVRGSANGSACVLRSSYALGWSNNNNASTGTLDLQLLRDAANVLALRNGTNPQAFLIENTWTNSTNRETGFIRWTGNVFCIGTEKGNLGGVAQRLELQTDAVTRLRIDDNYQIRVGDQGTNAPSLFTFAVSNTTANGPGRGLSLFGRNNVVGGTHIGIVGDAFISNTGANVLLLIGNSFVPTSGNGTYTASRVAPIINQTGGANGICRGVSVEPTLTSAADWRSFDTMVNSGFAYHSSGTAPSHLGGPLTFSPFAASHTPAANNQLTFERISDSALNFVYRGNDGTTRKRDLFANVESFETVSQSLSAFPAAINYSSGRISSIVYTLPNASTITKTINYTGDRVTSIVLSGATPAGIQLTKTLTYTGDNLTGVSYS